MRTNKSSLRSTVRSVPFAVAAALVVTGCSNTPFARVGEYQRAQHNARMAALAPRAADEQSGPPTQLTRPDERDYVASAAYWGAQVQANPDDVDANLNFSRNLRMMGGAAQAVSVMRALVLRDPGNARVLAEYGKALTAAERPQDAIGFLTQAIQLSPNDWTLLSARGVANDQANNHTAARDDYRQALVLDEDNAVVLTNLAMSYVLSGQPDQAEPILRRVVGRADATAAMRQNLAMVLALQGRKAEAMEFGKIDLEPEDAQNNAQLFAQFQTKPSGTSHTPAPQIVSSASPSVEKLQVAAPVDAGEKLGFVTPSPITGDPMATPVKSPPATLQSAAEASPVMSPIADDTATVTKSVAVSAKPKPAKRPAAKAIASAAAGSSPAVKSTPPVTSNGETLITTINGIPVIGDAKPKGKPSAAADGLLRGGAL